MTRFLLPLAGLALLLGFLFASLHLQPNELPSPLLGKPLPAITLPPLKQDAAAFDPASLRGQVWLLNVWASWCPACREENPFLLTLKQAQLPTQLPAPLAIIGLNYKDQRQDGELWLRRFGNPFQHNLFDAAGTLGLELGVYGVPESFLIDQYGIIRVKHNGPLNVDIWDKKFLPVLQKLQRAAK